MINILSSVLTSIVVYAKSRSALKTLKWGLIALVLPPVLFVAFWADRRDL